MKNRARCHIRNGVRPKNKEQLVPVGAVKAPVVAIPVFLVPVFSIVSVFLFVLPAGPRLVHPVVNMPALPPRR